MTPRRVASAILLAVLVSLTSCAPVGMGARRDVAYGVSFERGAFILTGRALTDGPGSVLGAMSGKVPNFRVQRGTGECPEISLRNHVSVPTAVNPPVYVDGTRTTDTCILESLRTEDVERVEVYPQGFTTRPGYGTHAYGLILVFMRSG
jgi:hypothetical protein